MEADFRHTNFFWVLIPPRPPPRDGIGTSLVWTDPHRLT